MRFVYTVDRVTMMIRTYSELSKLKTFKERYEYLRLGGEVGEDTFGFDRYLNQIFYRSMEWKSVRDFVIVRDNGCDLGIEGHEIWEDIDSPYESDFRGGYFKEK